MTNPNHRHVLLIVDRSGSMGTIQKDMEGGIRSFLEDQKQLPQRTTVGLVDFDTRVETHHWFTDLKDVGRYRLVPRGMTALRDTVGQTVVRLGEDLAALPEDDRPGQVVVVIVTDGLDNRSVEYGGDALRALLLGQQETYGWEFIYLGANQDAVATGQELGIPAANSVTYTASGLGTESVWSAVSGSVLRGASGLGYGFTDEEREASRRG